MSGTFPNGDVILVNGAIHTMDANDTVARVIAIKGGTIVYVGDDPDHPSLDRATPRRDLEGRTVVPGLVDVHNHIVLMGNRPGHHTPLENAYSIGEVQETYARRAQALAPGEFITTIGGFHPNQFKEHRLPTLAELDEAIPGHPAYLSVGFTGPSATNSPGKRFFEAVPSPLGPIPVGADGSIDAHGFGQVGPTGQATLALRNSLTFDERKQSARDAMAYAAGLGVTLHLDQGAFQATGTPSDGAAHEDNFRMHLPFLAVYDEAVRGAGGASLRGLVRLRINFLTWDSDESLPVLNARIQNAFPFFGDDLVRTGAIGEFFTDMSAYTAERPVWMAAATRVAEAGWRAEIHSLTPTDFQTQIEGFEALNAKVPITDLRWVIAHVPFITEDYVRRLEAVGGGVNLTGFNYLAAHGPQSGPPYRMLVDSGIPLAMSSDGMQIAPMNPWVHAYYATTGLNSLGEQINPGQQISRAEFLRHYTATSGWFLGKDEEDRFGVLAPGRVGDLAVLSDDYFTVSDDALRALSSVLTVVGGSVVHDAGVVR